MSSSWTRSTAATSQRSSASCSSCSSTGTRRSSSSTGRISSRFPQNLLLIGTMNTADRSIALVDAALRRRFFFIPFIPTEEPVAGVLRSWLKENERDELPALLLDELNRRIAKDEVAIGPSYLMSGDGSRESLERIWRHAILPLLDEHYYGTKVDVHTEFGLEACLDAVKGAELQEADHEEESALDTSAATTAP